VVVTVNIPVHKMTGQNCIPSRNHIPALTSVLSVTKVRRCAQRSRNCAFFHPQFIEFDNLCSCSGVVAASALVGCDSASVGNWFPTFRDNVMVSLA